MNTYVETKIEKDERKITFWIYRIYLNSILHSWWRGTMQKYFLLWSFALSSPYEYTDIQKHSCSHTLFSQVWQKVQRPLGNNLNNMADTVTAKLFVYTNENQVTKYNSLTRLQRLGIVHFTVTVAWRQSNSPTRLQRLGMMHLEIALAWPQSNSPTRLQRLVIMYFWIAAAWPQSNSPTRLQR